jgi:hypothetical protein
MRTLTLAKVYQKLEPGPVVLLTTARVGRGGAVALNVMTMSWHMMVEFEPPLIACIVADGDYSHAALRKNRRMRHRHPRRGSGRKSRRHRQLFGARGRQIRPLRPDRAAGFKRRRAADRRMRRQYRMPRGR